MAQQLLNTLFVQTPGAYVRLEGDTLRVEVEERCLLRVPLHHLGAVVLFGNNTMSTAAMQRCANEGLEVSFLDFSGRFRCRVAGATHGNVLLRLAQYEAFRDTVRHTDIARRFVAAKVRNSRQTLLRSARDAKTDEARQQIAAAAAVHAVSLSSTELAFTLDELRGVEGQAAAEYFAVFGQMITVASSEFAFAHRTRRPPRDRVNALLSFGYALLAHDCSSALDGVGLDPQLGFLHGLRSGRPALALDLMEEFRSCIIDRLSLTLINRRQIRPEHFAVRAEAGESVLLNEAGRKIMLAAYQEHKETTVQHPLLKTATLWGLIPHLQARLFARFLRGETDHYQPFLVE